MYHLTCRGGQFQDGIEQITTNEAFHKMKNYALNLYINKWGTFVQNNEYQYPILSPVYKKSINISNSSTQLEEILKPWFNEGKDIIVNVDGKTFTQQDFIYIQQLNSIIKDSGEVGEFELGNLKIKINSLDEYQNTLIKL